MLWMKKQLAKFMKTKEESIYKVLICAMIVAAIFSIGYSIFTRPYEDWDTEPATSYDYEKLFQKAMKIQENPDLLLETNCTIKVKGYVTEVKFEDSQCSLSVVYDKDFKVKSLSKNDKAISMLAVSWYCIVITIFVFFMAFIPSIIGVIVVILVWNFIDKNQK